MRSFWAKDWEGTQYEAASVLPADALPNEVYHRDAPGVSKTGLDRVRRNIRSFLEPDEESTPAIDLGAAVNDALLHPHRFAELYLRGPEDRRGNKWKDAKEAAEAAGLNLLVGPDYDRALLVRDALLMHPVVRQLADQREAAEDSYFWEDEETGLLCRCRPDWTLRNGILVDLKALADAEREAFRRAVFRFRYHVQAGFYCEGVKRVVGGCPGMVFVTIDKEDPCPENVALYQLDDQLYDEGYLAAVEDMRRLAGWLAAEEREPGQWRGYPREIQTITYFRNQQSQEEAA